MTPTLASAHRPRPAQFIRAVYWLTPLFVAIDYISGVSLRIPFLDGLPSAKIAYYAVEIGCGIVVAVRPRLTATVGFAESVVNISLLVLSTGAAYLAVLESAASPNVVIVNPFTPEAVASLVLSASVMGASYALRPRSGALSASTG